MKNCVFHLPSSFHGGFQLSPTASGQWTFLIFSNKRKSNRNCVDKQAFFDIRCNSRPAVKFVEKSADLC